MFRSLPDTLEFFTPMKGRALVNGYLNSPSGKKSRSYMVREMLKVPGVNQSIYQYLTGPGKDKLPEIVGRHLGDHWYTGPAKFLSKLPIVKDMVLDKVMENTLPKINGSTNVARQFLAAGGNL